MENLLIPELDYDSLDESCFVDLANTLLNKCHLNANGVKWRLTEIEFYLNGKIHVDPYVHCDPDQLLCYTFYFHKFKSGTYKSGTFKGMDITLGSEDDVTYFGILIRSICNIETGEFIEGPCNSVNKLLSAYGYNNISDLTNYKSLDVFDNEKKFHLEFNAKLKPEKIFAGPRIGLSDKYMEWRDVPYRFVVMKNSIKKRKTTLKEIEQ
ncbi:hypothetical protein QLL95_gp0573 [Cotonvirus japonicus]|uniref:Uncharacterized protein n=1 Tax=Cotonvirus japonicus TaxID=2811091 RepID=A0ABM7NTQ2_9VIRU|nr:hypothetical protein QLL95_gp0573 [Cotonvirus japonicus]BCS83550.1 hypothetical protein [Cotonvirus japonicus]